MTKYLGSLVGQPVASGGFPAISNFYKDGIDKVIVRDQAQVLAGGAVGDQVSIGFFKSNALLSMGSALYFDNLGANVTVSVGSKVYPAALNTGVVVSAKGMTALLGGLACALMFQPLWKMLGYAADPGGMLELLVTFAGAAPAAGGIAWQVHGYDHA